MANAKLNHHKIMQLRDEMNPVKPPLAITLCYPNMYFFYCSYKSLKKAFFAFIQNIG